jgi:hypothetical protein
MIRLNDQLYGVVLIGMIKAGYQVSRDGDSSTHLLCNIKTNFRH